MSEREIKLELAKIAIGAGDSLDRVKSFYDWITSEAVDNPTQWDDIPIEKLAYTTNSEGIIIKRCKENGINTIGDLIRCGAHKFRTFRLVGGGMVSKIDEALEEHFGYPNWYTT